LNPIIVFTIRSKIAHENMRVRVDAAFLLFYFFNWQKEFGWAKS
jgi:hypothetical protein